MDILWEAHQKKKVGFPFRGTSQVTYWGVV